LKKLGVTVTALKKTDREDIRKKMSATLWPSFTKQYPSTQAVLDSILATKD
jgi:hypothetical protein